MVSTSAVGAASAGGCSWRVRAGQGFRRGFRGLDGFLQKSFRYLGRKLVSRAAKIFDAPENSRRHRRRRATIFPAFFRQISANETIGQIPRDSELGKGRPRRSIFATTRTPVARSPSRSSSSAKDDAAMSRRMQAVPEREGWFPSASITRISFSFEAVVEEDFAYLAMGTSRVFARGPLRPDRQAAAMHRVIGIIFKCCMALDAPTGRASSTATSNRPASWSPPTTRPRSPTSAWPEHEQGHGPGLDLHHGRRLAGLHVAGTDQGTIRSTRKPTSTRSVILPVADRRLPFRANEPGDADLSHHQHRCAGGDLAQARPAGGPQCHPEAGAGKDLYNRYRNGPDGQGSVGRALSDSEDSTVERIPAFRTLRRLEFFTEFETSKSGKSCALPSGARCRRMSRSCARAIASKFFGVIVSGSVEMSIEGGRFTAWGPSEPVGEVAFLHPSSDVRLPRDRGYAGADPVPRNQRGGLALSSGSCWSACATSLLGRMIDRLREVNRIAAAQGLPAGGYRSPPTGGSRKPGGGSWISNCRR